jgi:hypothetical protein
MRRWGLYGVWLLILAIVVTGCGSASNADKSSDSATASSDKAVQQESKFESESLANMNQSADKSLSMGEVSTADSATDGSGGSEGGNAGTVSHTTAENTGKIGAGFTGSDVVAGLNKKLIYRANLNMEVESYAKAQTEVRNMVTLAQGYIIEFNENMSEYEQGGTFIMKVPASGFSSFLGNLEKVKHEKLQRSIQGDDVSEEYVDLESRLKAKQLMESQYTEFMKKATKSADLVAFANQLGAIQEEIERIKGRMRYIDQNVSFSTVELRLYQTDASFDVQKKAELDPLGTRASNALNGSLHALSVTFQWLVVILAGALPILIGAALVLMIVLVYRRRRQRHHGEQSQLVREGNRQSDGTRPNSPATREPSPENSGTQERTDQTQPKVEQPQSEETQAPQSSVDSADSRESDNRDKK